MRSKKRVSFLLGYCILFLLGVRSVLWGQTQNFRHFGTENGLPENYVQEVSQDNKGYLWVSTSSGVYTYDGQLFTKFVNAASKEETGYNVCKVLRDRYVLGAGDGKVDVFKAGVNFPVKRLKPFDGPVNKLFLSPDSLYTYIVSNGRGVMCLNNNTYELRFMGEALKDMIINDLVMIDHNFFFIASSDGLYLYNYSARKLQPLDDNIEALCLSWNKLSRILYVGTKSFGLNSYLLGTDYQIDVTSNLFSKLEGPDASISAILPLEPGKSFYIGTSEGNIYQLDVVTGKLTSYLNRPLRVKISSLFADKTGNMWLCTFGKGLLRSGKDPFEKFYQGHNISALTADPAGNFYMAEEERLYLQNFSTGVSDTFSIKNGLPDDKITALHCDRLGTIWVGFANNGLYYKSIGQIVFKPFAQMELFIDNPVNAITSSIYNEVYVSTTLNGVVAIGHGSITAQYNTRNNLPHNNILFTYVDSRNRIWFATHHSTLSYLEEGKIYDFSMRYPTINFDINAITEDTEGQIWFMSRDNGVYAFKDTLRYIVNTDNGLPSNFGTAVICDESNQIWIAQTDLLTKFSLSRNILKTYSTAYLLDNMYFNKNACYKDKKGNLWFGTTEGIVKYNRPLSQSVLPEAQPYLLSFKVFDEIRSLNQKQRLQYGTYNVSFHYSALCLTQSEDVLFRYMLEGYDNQWSEPTKRLRIDYENLKDGVYNFKVMACNSDGLWNKTPLVYTFVIEKPFWKTIWFWTIIALLFILSVTLFNYYRTRMLVHYNKELSKRVNEKTKQLEEEKQVIIQKNKEIEQYNEEINASINYARHIQRSVLPDRSELNNQVFSSFVINKPKDVISGDFYKVYHQEHKTLVVLADSTGHGVPGALLSMMGNSLIDTIIESGTALDPSAILYKLDKAIIHTLQQKPEDFTNESMDVALLVVDTQNHTITYAGAKRPLYIVRNGELQEYPGGRFPVGGLLTRLTKEFVNHQIQLQDKDCFYIFSDGFCDQFDRENKTKFSTKRFKELLVKQWGSGIPSQEFEINSALNNWKGSNEQTDDIMLIGVQYKIM